MKLKKVFGIALAMALSFSLAACGSSDNTSSNADLQPFETQLATPGVILIGISPDYPPYDTYDESGNVAGFDVDMMNELAKYLGTEEAPYKLEFVPSDFQTIISSLNAGQVDLGVSGFTYDPARECLFSDAYLNSAQVIVVNKESGITSVEQLSGKTIVAGGNTTGDKVAKELAEQYGNITVSNPTDYGIMFESLKGGAVQAVVCDKAVAENFVAANENLMMLEGEYDTQDMSIIVKKGNEELLNKINEAIAQFKESDAYTQLVEKWQA